MHAWLLLKIISGSRRREPARQPAASEEIGSEGGGILSELKNKSRRKISGNVTQNLGRERILARIREVLMKKEAVAKSKLSQALFLSNGSGQKNRNRNELANESDFFLFVFSFFFRSCSIFFLSFLFYLLSLLFLHILPENEKRATLGELSGAREMAFSSCFSEDLKTTLKNWSQKLEAPEFPEISLLGSQSSFSFFPSFLPSPLFHIFSPDSQDLKLYHQLDNRFQDLSIKLRREKERKVSGKQARKEK